MLYRPEFFKLVELVNPRAFKERGERAWEYLDPYALLTLDQLRKKFGPMRLNDWADGGQRDEAGLRDFLTKTGAEWSLHKFGKAFDPKPTKATPREVYDYVLAHPDEFPHITCVENIEATPTWFHFDTRNHGRSGIWVVNPV